MNTISKVIGVITRPARTVGTVAAATVGVGLRTTARVVGWAVERASDPGPEQATSTRPPVAGPEAPAAEAAAAKQTPADEAPTRKAQVKRAPAKKKAPAKKATARKAPSKKAAVMAPALGITEAEVEAGTLQRAADPDKG